MIGRLGVWRNVITNKEVSQWSRKEKDHQAEGVCAHSHGSRSRSQRDVYLPCLAEKTKYFLSRNLA